MGCNKKAKNYELYLVAEAAAKFAILWISSRMLPMSKKERNVTTIQDLVVITVVDQIPMVGPMADPMVGLMVGAIQGAILGSKWVPQ